MGCYLLIGGFSTFPPRIFPFVSPPPIFFTSFHDIKCSLKSFLAMSKKRSRRLVASNSGSNKGGTGDDGSKHRKLSKLQSKQGAATMANYYKPKQIIVGAPIDRLLPQERIDLIAELSESILEDPATALTSSRTTVGGVSNTTTTTTTTGSKGKKQHHGGEKETDTNNDSTTKKEPLYHKTQSKMNQLLDLASISHNGHDAHAARLALLSLLAIFQDILPSYRIRLPTESEMDVRVSKETKATWDYERKLLQSYQKYLQLLERTWDDGKFGRKWATTDSGKEARLGGQPPTTLAATSILAISALLQTCYNFNFRSNLLHIVTRQANHRTSEEVRISCCNALSTMFTKDVQGEASLEAVRFMAKMIKQQSSSSSPSSTSIHPDLVNTWLSLPLRVHEDEAMAAKLASAAKSKKAKKSQEYKDTLDIEKEMKEGEASVDKIELAKNQADTLHAVTITYFRILKLVVANTTTSSQEENVDNTTTSQSQQRKKTINASSSEILLLPCALRGLAKFSHLIHLDAMVNLLAVLKDLLKNVSSLPTEAAAHCILCALKTLRGSGRDTLPVDPKEYLIPLYNLLPRLGIAKIDNNNSDSAGNSNDKTVVEAAIQCLDHAFLQRRELSMARLAAFIKRIVSTSLHCQPHLATPLLASSRQISARYSSSTSSKIGRMLENEEDIVAEGMFSPDAEDPEHSNAHATSLWELALMKYSVNPKVAEHSLAMAEGKLLKLPGESPGKIWTSMDRDVKEGFISYKVVWKKHPLDNTKVQSKEPVNGDSRRAKMYEEAEMSRKKRRQQLRAQNQIRFITPRRTGNWHFKEPTSYSML